MRLPFSNGGSTYLNHLFDNQAGMASAAPPLGTQLGQVGINVAAFVKDFNLKTSIMKPGMKEVLLVVYSTLLN